MSELKIDYKHGTISYDSFNKTHKYNMVDFIINHIADGYEDAFRKVLKEEHWTLSIIKCIICGEYYIYDGKNDVFLKLDFKPDKISYIKCDGCRVGFDTINDEHGMSNQLKSKLGGILGRHIYT